MELIIIGDHLDQRGTKDERGCLDRDLLVHVDYSYRPELGLTSSQIRNASISLSITTYQVIRLCSYLDCYRPLPLASRLFYLPTETVYCTTARLPSSPVTCHKRVLTSGFNPNKPSQCETLAASPHSSGRAIHRSFLRGHVSAGAWPGLKPHTGMRSLLGVQTIKITESI